MKKGFFLFVFALSSTLLFAQQKADYSSFVLNDSFSHAQPEGSTIVPQKYQLTSLKGFKLDCSKYDFSLIRSLNGGKNPTAIFLVTNGGNYMVPLLANGETLADASTITSIDYPEKKFTLFEKGDKLILAIGDLSIAGGKADMRSNWISMIDVK